MDETAKQGEAGREEEREREREAEEKRKIAEKSRSNVCIDTSNRGELR